MKKTWKNQKPTEIDCNLRYICPKKNCKLDHWISLRESKTENFIIVCDCGEVFSVKPVVKIKIIYKKIEDNNQKTQDINLKQESSDTVALQITEDIKKVKIKYSKNKEKANTLKLPVDTQNSCVRLLRDYGFSIEEAIDLTKNAFEKTSSLDSSVLIRFILKNLET
jgi:hypothetical protein